MTTREKAEKIVRQEGGCAGFNCYSDGERCPLCRPDDSCVDGGYANHLVVARKWLAEHPEEPPAESSNIAKLRQIAAGSCAGWQCDQCPLHDWHKVRSCGVSGLNHIGNPEAIAEAVRQLRKRGVAPDGRHNMRTAPTSEIILPDIIISFSGVELFTPNSSLVDQRRAIRRRLLGL